MIKLVLFDGDDTLWDFQALTRRSLQHCLDVLWEELPAAAAQLTVEHMIEIRDRVATELEGRVLDLAAVRLAAFEQTLEELDLPNPELAGKLNATYFHDRFQDIPLFADTRPALEALRGRYRLGLCTNGNTTAEEAGIADLLDFTVRAPDVGYSKPHPAMFEAALDSAQTRPAESVMVGDTIELDIYGAQAAGIFGVLVDRSGDQSGDQSGDLSVGVESAVAVIRSLGELPELLEDLNGSLVGPPGSG